MTSEKALVVFSGGQDSTTCLAIAHNEHAHTSQNQNIEAVIFDYNQRHKIEIEQAKIICDKTHTPYRVIDLSWMGQITENALTRNSIKIEQKEGQLPSTFVDGRNHIFLSVAAIVAKQRGIQKIYTGVCQTDFSGYPDCRDDFVKSLNHTLNLAMAYSFELLTPLMWLTKAETVLQMQKLGKLEWLKDSHTCYEGLRPACGVCPACKLRLKGFSDAGLTDPLDYLS